MTSPMSPLGGVHDDERMLDELAARSYAGGDELGQALNAWARRVDAQAEDVTGRLDIDELIRRHAVPVTAEEPTTIRIRASRLIAALGGVGVAAAALGIALANGYNVPGLPSLTPSQSATSVVIDQQQLLAEAKQLPEEVKSGAKPKKVALDQIAQLQAQATDPVVKEELQSIREEVAAAPVPSAVSPAATATVSPSSVPKIVVPVPDVMTTPIPQTTPMAPEKPSSVPSTDPTSIPTGATSTPAPDTSSTSPSSSSSTSPTSKSTSRTVSLPGRPKTPPPASHSAPAQEPVQPTATTHDVATSGAGSLEPEGSSAQPSAAEPVDP